MISHKLLFFVPMAILLALPAPGISQQLINVNFNNLGAVPAGGGAGAYSGSTATDTWNTFSTASSSGALKYSDGTPSQLSISYYSQAVASGTPTLVGAGSTQHFTSGVYANTSALMNGYLYNNTTTAPATVQITGLAPNLSFSLYVLVFGGDGQAGRLMNVTVNGTQLQAGPSTATFTSFAQGTTYLLFTGTADATGAISISMLPTGAAPAGGWAEADLNGLQLVGALNTPPSCVTTLSPQGGESFPTGGGNANIAVTAPGCGWTSSSPVNWVGITSGASGTGNGTVTINVAPNTGTVRSASINVAGNSFTVQQDTGATAVELQPLGSMAQIASGGGWDTTLTLVNTSGAPIESELGFSANNGAALALPFTFPQQTGGAPTFGATWDQMVNPHATLVIDTTSSSGAASTGWAQLLSTNAAGFAIFTYTPTGQAAVVPLETRNAGSYLLAFDDTGVVATGLAIANLATSAANVNVVIRNDAGTQIGTGSIDLPASGHTSFMLTDTSSGGWAATSGVRGTVEFDTPSGGQISVLGLRANGAALTTLPVLANVGTAGGTLAHFAAGGGGTAGNGWQTTFTLVNTGTAAATANLHFFDSDGNAASLPLSFPQTGSTTTSDLVSRSIDAGASLIVLVQDTGGSTAVTGSAVLTTSGNVSGFAVFRYNPSGQEAVVPLLVDNAGSYLLAFDNTGSLATGLAIANVAPQAANVAVVLRNDTGAKIGTGSESISLPANGHTSFMLTDTSSGGWAVTAGIRGTIEFVTPTGGQIAPLGLRAASIASGFTITTIPVIEKTTAAGSAHKQFAPYIDMSVLNNNDLSSISSASGIKTFTLAFITSNGCQASWFGTLNVPGETTIQPVINAFGAGNTIVSFGGANGFELAQACSSASAIQAQYQAVVNYYGVNNLDFDIEGAALTSTASVDLRNQALAALQSANPGLTISYTLPVLPAGLTSAGTYLLSSAKSHGVNVAVVNVMAMDYGGADSHMGTDATSATIAAHAQVQTAGLSSTMGCTAMIGQNDTSGEIFQLADAQTLVTWANPFSYVTRLSYWEVGRDNGGCAGTASAESSCSGISQNPYQFAGIFEGF